MFKNLFSKNKSDAKEPEAKVTETEVSKEEVKAPEPDSEPKELVNRSIGMENCGEMEDMFKEMLELFAESKDEKKAEIQEEYAAEDWENYRIHVHALKSTSLTVGLEPLHLLAKDVELTAKEILTDESKKDESVAFIKAHHDELMKLYDDSCVAALEVAAGIEV